MKTHVEFSLGDFWGQPMLLIWKLVDESQISKPPEPTRYHKIMDPQGVGALGELLINFMFVATSWGGFSWEIGNLF